MVEIRRYVVVNQQNIEDDHEYESYYWAEADARSRNAAVLARVYEYTDTELVWTPDGSGIWPSEKATP